MTTPAQRSPLLLKDRGYQVGFFEVLDANRHVYSTTQVHGGGGFVVGGSHGVYGQINPVESTTQIHNESRVWLRNVETGKEIEIHVPGGISVRAGHRLIGIWVLPEGRLERVANIENDVITLVDGYFWQQDIPAKNQVWGAALVRALVIATPIFNGAWLLIWILHRGGHQLKNGSLMDKLANVPGINGFIRKIWLLIAIFMGLVFVSVKYFGMHLETALISYPPIFAVLIGRAMYHQNKAERAWYVAEVNAINEVTLDAMEKYRKAIAATKKGQSHA